MLTLLMNVKSIRSCQKSWSNLRLKLSVYDTFQVLLLNVLSLFLEALHTLLTSLFS